MIEVAAAGGEAQARKSFTLGEKTQVMCAYERGPCGQPEGGRGRSLGERPQRNQRSWLLSAGTWPSSCLCFCSCLGQGAKDL